MDPLATVDDVEARLGRVLTESESLRIQALLADASAAVRGWTGQTFTRGEQTATLWHKSCCDEIRLTGKDIADLVAVDEDDADVELEQVGPNRWTASWSGALTLTYTAGWDPIPDDIVAVVAQVAGRALGVNLDASGITQESTGPFSVSYGSAGASGGLGFLAGERQILNRYRVSGAPRNIGVRPWVA